MEQPVRFAGRVEAYGGRILVTPALVMLNVLVFLAMWRTGAGFRTMAPDTMFRWGANFGLVTADRQWWRLVASMFLHGGIEHLVLNMAVLAVVGVQAERWFGSGHFLALYMLSGLAAGLLRVFLEPTIMAVGASGAIYGVFGGLLAFALSLRTRVPAAVRRRYARAIVAFVAYNVAMQIGDPRVGTLDHIGGFLAGLPVGLLLARPLDRERRTPISRPMIVTLLVALVVGSGAAWIARERGMLLRDDLRFEHGLKEFIADEAILVGRLDRMSLLVQGNRISAETYAQFLEKEQLPLWSAWYAGFHRFQLSPASPRHALKEAIERYLATRRRNIGKTIEAIRTRDPRAAEEARATGQAVREQIAAVKKLMTQ